VTGSIVRGYDDELLARAVRLHRIPGVTSAEVCQRLGISNYALTRARKTVDRSPYPWPRDLLLSALTDTGLRTHGAWPTRAELTVLASYIDFVNKDGSTPETVAAMLEELVAVGILERSADGFVLLQPFP